MEMVLRLKISDMAAVSWERAVRGCLILILSCILYLYVRGYTADYENEFDKDTVSKGIVLPNCGKEMSAAWGDVRGISMKLRSLEKKRNIEKNIGIDRNIAGEQNVDDAALPPLGIDVVLEECISVWESDFHSETEENQEQVLIIQDSPDEGKETEIDVSFTGEEESLEDDVNNMKEIAGFFVDSQGYITGTTDNLNLTDGVLVIPSDEMCVGIRKEAFAGIGSDGDEVMEIFIPANMHDIEQGAFDKFEFLMYIEVARDNPCYCSIDGVLYTRSGEEIFCPAGR